MLWKEPLIEEDRFDSPQKKEGMRHSPSSKIVSYKDNPM